MLESHTQICEDASIIEHGRDEILEYKFEVPGLGTKCLKHLSSKEIYNIFLLNQSVDVKAKAYWCSKFGIDHINWDLLFAQNLQNKYMPRKCKDFNWKLFHGLINTESRLKRMHFSDGCCKICANGLIEDLDHLLMECSSVAPIWNLIESIIYSVFGTSYVIDLTAITLGFWGRNGTHNMSDTTIVNVLMSIARYHIWKVRNCIKYGNENISVFQSIKRVKIDLDVHLKTLNASRSTCLSLKGKIESVLAILKCHKES